MHFLRKHCPSWFPKSLIGPLALLVSFTLIIGIAGVIFRALIQFWWYYLPYNMLLAGLPLVFSCGALWTEHKRHRLLALPLWLLWLFFYPNAPYILTDLIHLRNYDFFAGGIFNSDPAVWFGFLHLCAGVMVGCCYGLISLLLLQRHVVRTYGRAYGWSLAVGTSLLSGVGIWIGRCMRFNTWDIWHRPLHLLRSVIAQFDRRALLLCLLFAAMSAGAYLLLRVFFPEETVLRRCQKHDIPVLAAMLKGTRYEEYLDSRRLMVAEVNGALAGFAYASPYSGDCRVFVFVAPEYRRHGIGMMLYAWVERRARRSRSESLWSTYYEPAESVAFVSKIGYDRLTGNDYMRYAGGLLPEKPAAIRNYTDADFDRVFYITSHAWHDLRLRTGVTDSKVHTESGEIRRSYRRNAGSGYIIEDNGEIVAYGSFDEDMIGSVCVDPALYNRGYGRALAIFLTNEILRRGNKAAYLWCEHGNDNARHIYESLGYETQYTGWSPIKKLRK